MLLCGVATGSHVSIRSGATCRSAFEAPIEPKMVLGGYPSGSDFSSFLDNTTALLITFPVDARESLHYRAMAWEHEFLQVVCK